MKTKELHDKSNEMGRVYLEEKYGVRTYPPYTNNEVYSDNEELVKMFLDDSNGEEFIEVGEDGTGVIVYLWNTEATEHDIKLCNEANNPTTMECYQCKCPKMYVERTQQDEIVKITCSNCNTIQTYLTKK